METTKLLIDGSELLNSNDIPVTIKNKILISPGTWNDIKYTAEELEKAYLNTNWSDKSNYSLYLDHKDTKNEGVGNWVGYIKNIKMQDKGVVVGDLEVWNPLVAIYLTNAKAKFGISATLKGMENKTEGKLESFRFESFSIVTDPACKESFINFSQNKQKGGKMAEIIEKKVTLEEDNEIEDDLGETEVEEAKEDEEAKKKEEDKKKKIPEEAKCEKKKKYPVPYDEETMSEDELFSITTNSDWTDFVKKMKAKYPDMAFKDIAKSYKEKGKEMEELEQLSEDEIVSRIQMLTSMLKRKSNKAVTEETPDAKMAKLESTVKELQSKMNEPDRKTLSTASSSQINTSQDPLKAMADFLAEGGQGSFGL